MLYLDIHKIFLSLKSLQYLTLYKSDQTYLNGILQKGSRQLFRISASSNLEGFEEENVLNDDDTYYHSNNQGEDNDPWFKIQFNELFYLQNYTFKTRHAYNDNYPNKWELEGSFDDKKYYFIDSQDTKELNENEKTKMFSVEHPGSFKFFKFKNILTIEGKHLFTIRCIDFFGYYVKNGLLKRFRTCRKVKFFNFQVYLSIIILINRV